jgi:hypothetical protein
MLILTHTSVIYKSLQANVSVADFLGNDANIGDADSGRTLMSLISSCSFKRHVVSLSNVTLHMADVFSGLQPSQAMKTGRYSGAVLVF